MESLSGFWAGQYSYAGPHAPSVKFDCELNHAGPSLTGHTTEVDVYKPAGRFLLDAILEGQVHKRDVAFTKTYVTTSEIYNQPVEYVGKIHASGDEISGQWFIGDIGGRFSLKRDKNSSRAAKTRTAANDAEVH